MAKRIRLPRRPPTDGGSEVINLDEQIEKVMAELSRLSNFAKRIEAMDSYYALNRAWNELFERSKKVKP